MCKWQHRFTISGSLPAQRTACNVREWKWHNPKRQCALIIVRLNRPGALNFVWPLVGWGSSVSTVFHYRLHYRGWLLEEAKSFSSKACVYEYTSSEAQPDSCLMRTVGSVSGVKRSRGVTFTSRPILCRGKENCRSYTYSFSWRLHGYRGQLFDASIYSYRHTDHRIINEDNSLKRHKFCKIRFSW